MKLLLSLLSIFMIQWLPAQVINGYAAVTQITGNVLTLSEVDESGGNFTIGENLILMQMQDDVIGSNTNDNESFGNLSNIGSAGLYEVIEITDINYSVGIPTSISLERAPNYTFSTGSNSAVQAITFPTSGNPNYTTTQNMEAKPWNGSIGGVIAFEVTGTLTLNHHVSASEKGFRGGSPNGGGSTGCTGSSNFRVSSQEYYADKGEGIYKVTNSTFAAGRAKIINGGGGGNSHNAGGGGGGNASAGGLGGPGWPSCSPTAGGMGGLSLDTEIANNRVFMGGGGGSGEGNNGGTQKGGNGGGIVLIKANEITSTGSTQLTISCNGESITTSSSNDGNSGGGAGGSVVFEVNNWNISASAPLKIESNGGDGGPALTENEHGGGGGGGLGTILFSTSTPTQFVTIENNAGSGGLNCNTCSTAQSGIGNPEDGVLESASGPLPVELIKFEATPNPKDQVVNIIWITASEINNDYFTIEKTKDLDRYEIVSTVTGQGTTNQETTYEEIDLSPFKGTSFYKLSQTDFDGKTTSFDLAEVKLHLDELCEIDVELYPNPTTGRVLFLKIPNLLTEDVKILVNDFLGKEFMADFTLIKQENSTLIQIELSKQLNPGTYMVNLVLEDKVISQGFIVR